jgi:holo-[acyl-carrier protein] synthase
MFDIENKAVGIGVDIENISRFRGLTIKKDSRFLNRLFTEKELAYCFSSGNPAQHLAARYTAKEAIIKALNALGRAAPDYNEIDIFKDDKGVPNVRIQKNGFTDLDILLSLSHSRESAIAFTVVALREVR